MFTVKTYINAESFGPSAVYHYPERLERGLLPGDYLTPGPELHSTGSHESSALAQAWTIGQHLDDNILDADGHEWPMDVRSLSVGDVLAIGETAWVIKGVGLRQLDTDEFERALCPKCPICSTHNRSRYEEELAHANAACVIADSDEAKVEAWMAEHDRLERTCPVCQQEHGS